MKDKEKKGIIKHISTTYGTGRTDSFSATIPLDIFSEEALGLLRYWCIEDFDCAFIDWEKHEIRLHYETEHFQK